MNLIPLSELSHDDLPIAGFRAHLRLGTGFSDDPAQQNLLESFLRAAIGAIEKRIQKSLLERSYRLRLVSWQSATQQDIPIAPVVSLDEIAFLPNQPSDYDKTDIVLRHDQMFPSLVARRGAFPHIDVGEYVDVTFTAGFAKSWRDLPADLAQAVFLLAAHYYTYREERHLGQGCMPFGVTSLIERYAPMRIGWGSAPLGAGV